MSLKVTDIASLLYWRILMRSVKAELETWGAALQAYDDQDFDKALSTFEVGLFYLIQVCCAMLNKSPQKIADSSKIHTNIGLIYATLGEHEMAVRHV